MSQGDQQILFFPVNKALRSPAAVWILLIAVPVLAIFVLCVAVFTVVCLAIIGIERLLGRDNIQKRSLLFSKKPRKKILPSGPRQVVFLFILLRLLRANQPSQPCLSPGLLPLRLHPQQGQFELGSLMSMLMGRARIGSLLFTAVLW